MRLGTLLIGLAALGLAACAGSDERQWMNVTSERATAADFHRAVEACRKDRKIDEACMKERGWVTVNPTKRETLTPDRDRPERRY